MAIKHLDGLRIQGLSYTAGSNGSHVTSTTNGSVSTAGTKSSREQETGFRVNAGHVLVGKKPTSITMEMFRASSLTTGVIKLAWRRASDTDGSGTALEDSDTVNNSTLSVGDYSGGNYNWGTVTFNFDGTNAIEAGDYFLTNVTVASGNDIKNKFKNANTEDNIQMCDYGASGVTFYSSNELIATINYTIPAVGDAKPTNVPVGTRYEETDTRKIFRRKGAAVSVAGLKAYFPMNEASGDVINKASAYGSTDAISNFDLTVTGGTQNTSGKIDKCVSFTGNNKAQADDSNLTDTNFISQTGAIWTICFWVKMDNRVGDQTFISTTDFGVGEDGFWIRMANSSGGINCICGAQGSSGRVNATSSSAVIPDTNWNFVMVQYSDTTGDLKMSVNDGTVETVATGQDITNTGTPAQKLILGNSPLLDNDMNGDMEALSIWNRVLTASEITTLYGNTTDVGQGLAASWKEKGTA